MMTCFHRRSAQAFRAILRSALKSRSYSHLYFSTLDVVPSAKTS